MSPLDTGATEAEARARFEADTADHKMRVLHDDGLYRHLAFRSPKTGMYWYDLVTWPNHLTISGDMGTWTFSRLEDMFEFFRYPERRRINAGYWAEKLQTGDSRGRDAAQAYHEHKYRRAVMDHFTNALWGRDDLSAKQAQDLWGGVWSELLDRDDYCYPGGHLDTAREAVRDFSRLIRKDAEEVSPGQYKVTFGMEPEPFRFEETYEWDLTGYSVFFLWACYAIQEGIHQYDEAKVKA